jgi:hypothetical protein
VKEKILCKKHQRHISSHVSLVSEDFEMKLRTEVEVGVLEQGAQITGFQIQRLDYTPSVTRDIARVLLCLPHGAVWRSSEITNIEAMSKL